MLFLECFWPPEFEVNNIFFINAICLFLNISGNKSNKIVFSYLFIYPPALIILTWKLWELISKVINRWFLELLLIKSSNKFWLSLINILELDIDSLYNSS